MDLELEPERLGALKTRRGFRLWVYQVTALRTSGFLLLSAAIGLHNRYILHEDGVPEALTFAGLTLAWSLASWAGVALLYRRFRSVGEVFLALDLVPFTLAVALTGGPASWLYPVLILRAADQVGAGFRRTVIMGSLSTACYAVLLVAWAGLFPDRPLPPAAYGVLAFVALSNVYLALTARTVDGLKDRTREAMRLARSSVRELETRLDERDRLEDERIRAQKLESLGALAGGVAHDFNNLLTGVLGNVTLLEARTPRDSSAWGPLQEVERACLRARDLTRQLLTFAKGGAPLRAVFVPGPVVRETATFALRGSTSCPEFEFADDLWRLEADEAQVAQVVQNLVINAAQAMPRGGVVRVALQNAEAGDVGRAGLDTRRRWIRLEVEDHGHGIDPGLQERIFDPYFTTKPKGSGLGLATTASIVSRHGGALRMQSEPDQGTRIHVFLPATEAEPPPPPGRPAHREGSGQVLVMDDDPMVRTVAGNMLRQLGFRPSLTADGEEAVEVFSTSLGQWTAVIMDLTVPGGLGGREAMERLRKIDPRVRAVVSSGYSEDPVMANYRDFGFRGVLAKPYTLDELSRALDLVAAGE